MLFVLIPIKITPELRSSRTKMSKYEKWNFCLFFFFFFSPNFYHRNSELWHSLISRYFI